MRSSWKGQAGFTLVELMVVVVILGVLAAVAIPAFVRYVRRSKTAEAVNNISRIYQAQIAYYQHSTEHAPEAGFVSAPGFTPDDAPHETKYPADTAPWTTNPAWTALGFTIATAHYYAYTTGEVGLGPGFEGPTPSLLTAGAQFNALAVGNLDGDETQSSFEVVGTLTEGGDVERSPVVITEELE